MSKKIYKTEQRCLYLSNENFRIQEITDGEGKIAHVASTNPFPNARRIAISPKEAPALRELLDAYIAALAKAKGDAE